MPDISTHRPKINPYTHVTFHKGYVHEKIKYLVLAVDQLPKDVVEMVKAKIKTMTSGPEVEKMVWRDKGNEQGWMYRLDNVITGKVGILSFRGTEIALFYKRQVSEIIPGPGEPLPEHRLDEPDDVWVRVDLIGPSARKANIVLKGIHEKVTESSKVKDQMLQAKEGLIAGIETKLHKSQEELSSQKKHMEILNMYNTAFRKALGARAQKIVEACKREQDRQRKAIGRRDAQITKVQASERAVVAKLQAKMAQRLLKKRKTDWTPANMNAKPPQRRTVQNPQKRSK